MIEIWRKDAVYTFDFWPGAEVKPLREIKFRVAGSEINVSYKWPRDRAYASAREVVAELEERCLRIQDETPVASSGVKRVEGGAREAWRCEVDLFGGELVRESIAREYDDGLVVSFERRSPGRDVALTAAGKLATLASRAKRADRGRIVPDEGELLYMLGPMQLLAPEPWALAPRVRATAGGDRFKFHEVEFEFSDSTRPPAAWFETPPEVQAYVFEDDMLVRTDSVEEIFAHGAATSISWGAVPPVPGPGQELLSDDVCTTVVTVIKWSSGSSCRITATQWIGTDEFDRDGDLVGLRDLILRIAASGRRVRRVRN